MVKNCDTEGDRSVDFEHPLMIRPTHKLTSFLPGTDEARSLPVTPGSAQGGSRQKLQQHRKHSGDLKDSELDNLALEETKGVDDMRHHEKRLSICHKSCKMPSRSKFSTKSEAGMNTYNIPCRDLDSQEPS